MGGSVKHYFRDSEMICSIVVLLVAVVGCSGEHARLGDKHDMAVLSGKQRIPQVAEMERLFGPTHCFITHFGIDDPPLTWNCNVTLYKRYRLSMKTAVRLNRELTVVEEVVGEPRFYLFEVTFVEEGRVEHIGEQHQFGLREWNKIVKAGGDFAAIGITVHPDRPVEGFNP